MSQIYGKEGDEHLSVITRGDINFIVVRRVGVGLLLVRRNEKFGYGSSEGYAQVALNEGEAAEIIGLRTNKMRFVKCREIMKQKQKEANV